MTLKYYVLILGGGMLFAWGSFALILMGTNPETATPAVFWMFYSSLFLGLTGILALLGIAVRTGILHKHDAASRQVLIATRQAALLALLLSTGFYLQAEGKLAWWSVLALIAGITVLELVFISARLTRHPQQH